jgi:hypothetical protein
MKTRFLFPHHWRTLGIILIFLGIIAGGLQIYFGEQLITWQVKRSNAGLPDFEDLIIDTVILLLICGLLLFAFSKERLEDEQISQLRLDSLQWAIYLNYALVLISILVFNSWDLLTVIGYNLFTPLVIFIWRFRWVVYRNDKLLNEAAV